jgi:hypothetical protein
LFSLSQLRARLEKYPIITQNRALIAIVEAANCVASSAGTSVSPLACGAPHKNASASSDWCLFKGQSNYKE